MKSTRLCSIFFMGLVSFSSLAGVIEKNDKRPYLLVQDYRFSKSDANTQAEYLSKLHDEERYRTELILAAKFGHIDAIERAINRLLATASMEGCKRVLQQACEIACTDEVKKHIERHYGIAMSEIQEIERVDRILSDMMSVVNAVDTMNAVERMRCGELIQMLSGRDCNEEDVCQEESMIALSNKLVKLLKTVTLDELLGIVTDQPLVVTGQPVGTASLNEVEVRNFLRTEGKKKILNLIETLSKSAHLLSDRMLLKLAEQKSAQKMKIKIETVETTVAEWIEFLSYWESLPSHTPSENN